MAQESTSVMDDSFRQVYEELAEEHRGLVDLVARIRAHREVIGLAPMIEDLHALLIRHFSREQFPGGLYERMGAYGSRYHAELKVLVEEHCTILSSVRGILERIRGTSRADEAVLLGDVRDVLDRLGDHERREHTLAEKLLGLGR